MGRFKCGGDVLPDDNDASQRPAKQYDHRELQFDGRLLWPRGAIVYLRPQGQYTHPYPHRFVFSLDLFTNPFFSNFDDFSND